MNLLFSEECAFNGLKNLKPGAMPSPHLVGLKNSWSRFLIVPDSQDMPSLPGKFWRVLNFFHFEECLCEMFLRLYSYKCCVFLVLL